MAIRDFATDGAFGGAGASDNSGAIPTGGYQADDGGMNGNTSGANDGGYSYTNSPGVSGFDYAHLGHYFQNAGQANSFDDNQSLAANPRNEMITNNDGDYWSKFNAAAANQDNRTAMFEGGGSVDDGASSGDGSSDVGSLLALALSSVDAGLNYGRQKYGLSQDKGQQQAAMGRTPAIPGNQSESGMPRPQPMPGPLPPTSNPFGQRRLGQNDQDQDDQGTQTAQAGAIPDNDEDDQEGTA